jgi:hypothetical protein
MLTIAERVELPYDSLDVFSKCPETDSEFPLLLFQKDQGSEKGWDQVVFTLTEQFHQELLIFGWAICFFDIIIFIASIIITLLVFLCEKWLTPENFVCNIWRVVELFLSSFG